MARITKLTVLAAWLLLSGVYFLTSSAVGSAKPDPPVSGAAEIYAASCARCHGANGKAQTAKGKRVGATDFTSDWNTSEARGIRIITNGKGEMPSFKKGLSADEIRSVFDYVLRFRH